MCELAGFIGAGHEHDLPACSAMLTIG